MPPLQRGVGGGKRTQMITFIIGKDTYSFPGTINVTFNKKYLFEKQDPFDASKWFRHDEYYTDTLQITIAFTGQPISYRELYQKVLEAESYTIQWDTGEDSEREYYRYREITEKLPFPSSLRFFDGEVSFTVETEIYWKIKPDESRSKPQTPINRKWNQCVIANTVWN